MRAYSQNLRQQVLRAVDEGKSQAQIIERYQGSRASSKLDANSGTMARLSTGRAMVSEVISALPLSRGQSASDTFTSSAFSTT